MTSLLSCNVLPGQMHVVALIILNTVPRTHRRETQPTALGVWGLTSAKKSSQNDLTADAACITFGSSPVAAVGVC